MMKLPGYLLAEHLGLDLEGSALDAGGWPLDRAEVEACLANGVAGAVTEGEREDFCWVLASALETDGEVWETLERQAQQPWVYELAESGELWREALGRFGESRPYAEAVHAGGVEIVMVPVRQWRAEMALHVEEVPLELAMFYLGEVLRGAAGAQFGVELEPRLVERVKVRADAHGEVPVVRAVLDHVVSAGDKAVSRLAGAAGVTADPGITRRLLQQLLGAAWPGAAESSAITLCEGSIPGYRASRHKQARLAAGLPW